MGALVLASDAVAVRVQAGADALAWLAEFVAPSLGVAPDDPSADLPTVALVADAARHAAVARAVAGAPATPVAAFGLDREVVRLPQVTVDGARVLVDAARGVFVVVAGRHAEVVAPAGGAAAGGAGRLPWLRAVREVAGEAVRRAPGHVQLHAAAFADPRGGVLLAGAKEAGKTTLLADRLARGGAAYVGNDRAVVRVGPDGAVVAGLPTVVSVRPGTLARFPVLAEGMPAVERPSAYAEAERAAAAATAPPWPRTERLRTTPAAFRARLGAPAVAAAPLRLVVLPSVAPDVDGVEATRVPAAAARAALEAVRYGADAGPVGATPFAAFVAAGPAVAPGPVLDAVVATVPVVRCRLGPTAYDGPGAGPWAAVEAALR